MRARTRRVDGLRRDFGRMDLRSAHQEPLYAQGCPLAGPHRTACQPHRMSSTHLLGWPSLVRLDGPRRSRSCRSAGLPPADCLRARCQQRAVNQWKPCSFAQLNRWAQLVFAPQLAAPRGWRCSNHASPLCLLTDRRVREATSPVRRASTAGDNSVTVAVAALGASGHPSTRSPLAVVMRR